MALASQTPFRWQQAHTLYEDFPTSYNFVHNPVLHRLLFLWRFFDAYPS